MFRKAISIVAAVFLLGVAVSAQQPAPTGERLFKNQCASCHSGDGSSNSQIAKRLGLRDLRAHEVQSLSDEELIRVISDGRGRMPAYGKYLNPEQISGLVRYLRSVSRDLKPSSTQSAAE